MVSSLNKIIFGTLFFSLFAAVTGVGIVVPLLPVYAHQLGAGGLAIGLIFGSFALSRTFLLPYFGRLSDRQGRKRLIVFGLVSYACLSLAFVMADSVSFLVSIRFFQGIASSMMMPAIQAYVGDITPPGREGFTMGCFNMSIFFGLSLGPILGGSINDHWGLDASFLIMGLLSLVGFFLSLVFLPPVHEEKVLKKKRAPLPWKKLLGDREILGLFIFRINYTACIGILWGFLPVLADTEFGLSSATIGFLVMLGVFISGVIHLPMGYVADRLNRRTMIIFGGMLVAVGMMYFARATSLTDLIIASVLFGFGGGISMPAHMAIAVFKGSQSDAMGSLMGIMTMAHSLGMLIGSSFAGIMMDVFNLRDAFFMGTFISLSGMLVFFLFTRGIPYPAVEKDII